jgi:peptidoglycan/LPS O-acetylase OafA/YrhL
MSHQKEIPDQRRPAHEVVQLWAIAILVLGLATAALIFVFAADDQDAEAAREVADGRMYQHNLELMGGKLMVFLAQFNDWFASLWHGTSLALTVAVLSVAIALGCFGVAYLMASMPPDESKPDRRS